MPRQPAADEERTHEDGSIREVRLRATYTALYPSVRPGVWMPAAEVSALVLFRRFAEQGPEALGNRPLIEEHFEFRGGWRRGPQPELKTRAEDADAAGPWRPNRSRD